MTNRIADEAVTGAKIAPGSITAEHLAPGLDGDEEEY